MTQRGQIDIIWYVNTNALWENMLKSMAYNFVCRFLYMNLTPRVESLGAKATHDFRRKDLECLNYS